MLRFTFLVLFTAFSVSGASPSKKSLTLENVFLEKKFADKKAPANLQWLPGEPALMYVTTNAKHEAEVLRLIVQNGQTEVWVAADKLVLNGQPIPRDYILVNPVDESVLFSGLVPARTSKPGGALYYYDRNADRTRRLPTGDASSLVQFSPDGKKIAYVRASNLYVLDLATDTEEQLTSDGGKDIFNGAPDWSYEEEFRLLPAWKWSPDSSKIAYLQINQKKVPAFPLVDYQEPHPAVRTMRYPKAGDPIPAARLGILDLRSLRTKWIDLPVEKGGYLPRLDWSPQGKVFVQALNRAQNRLELFSVDPLSGKPKSLIVEQSSTWVDVYNDLRFFKSTEGFIWSSRKSGYKHLYHYDMEGAPIARLTDGEWEVGDVVSLDEVDSKLYFTSNDAGAAEKQVHMVDLVTRQIKHITSQPGSHTATFSPNSTFFVDLYSAADAPPRIILQRNSGKQESVLHAGVPSILDYAIGKTEFFDIDTPNGKLKALRQIPRNFDPAKKYPVLMYAYGGPGSQKVLNEWGGTTRLFHATLLEKGFIVVTVDGRGTGGRGKNFEHQVYRQLGKLEAEDQIEAARWLAKQPWVDGSRIGLWGWSYGGYLSALALCQAGDVFKLGISVAPVTHWRYYDAPYTERFMGLPSDNAAAYEASSPLTHAAKLKGRLLVVHGTGDDNVHFQNSVAFIDKLVAENKAPTVMYYPYALHGLTEGKFMRYDLFQRMTDFLEWGL